MNDCEFDDKLIEKTDYNINDNKMNDSEDDEQNKG